MPASEACLILEVLTFRVARNLPLKYPACAHLRVQPNLITAVAPLKITAHAPQPARISSRDEKKRGAAGNRE